MSFWFTRDDRDRTWMKDAACRDTDASIFFPERHGNASAIVAAATAHCRGCPVQSECLEYGLREHHGVWGGLTETQRDKVRRRRRRGAA